MDFPIRIITQSPQETEKFGETLGVSYIEKGSDSLPRVLLCIGDLGSGKTTFVRGIAKGLGIHTRLPSPTYIIVRRYNLPKISPKSFLYHLDLYRMNTEAEVLGVGLDEMLTDTRSITIIEWPERMNGLLLKSRIECRFNVMNDGAHELTVEICKN